MLAAAVALTWLFAPGLARAGDIVISDGTFDSWKFASDLAGTGNPAATGSENGKLLRCMVGCVKVFFLRCNSGQVPPTSRTQQ
jgi:hypothetical protein